jgi:FkbM family methyltransferase
MSLRGGDTQIVATADGPMHVFVNDFYVSRSLALYGEWSAEETQLFRQIVKPGYTVVEAGANIGSHSVALARACAPGRLICFEPQPRVAQLLSANLVMNGCANAFVNACAVGAESGWAQIKNLDFSKEFNVGCAKLMTPQDDPEGSELVRMPLTRLDDWGLTGLNFLKIDTEGFELPVLQGAAGLIAQHRPIIYLENDRAEHQAALIGHVASLSYDLYWHRAPMYRPGNFRGYPQDVFGNLISSNMLCIPSELQSSVAGMEAIDPKAWTGVG